MERKKQNMLTMQKAKIKKNKPKNRKKKRRRHSPGGCCGNAKKDTQKTKHLKVGGGWNDDSHVTYVNQVTSFTFLPQICMAGVDHCFKFDLVINMKQGRAEVLELHPAHGFKMT